MRLGCGFGGALLRNFGVVLNTFVTTLIAIFVVLYNILYHFFQKKREF
jgi:hypothetical protein